MNRVAEEGDLLIAGPFGAPQRHSKDRGSWVFDTP